MGGPAWRVCGDPYYTARECDSVSMVDLPEWLADQANDIWYSTLDEGYTNAGALIGTSVSLKPRSITTVHSHYGPVRQR